MGNDFTNMFQEIPDSVGKACIKKYFYKLRVYHLLRIIFIQLRGRIVSRKLTLFGEDFLSKDYFALLNFSTDGLKSRSATASLPLKETELPFYAYPNESSQQAFAMLENTLEAIQQFLRERQIELIVVAVPSVKQIQAGLEHPVYTYPIQALENITQQHNMAFYNLAKEMIVYKNQHDLPYPYFSFECDGHFNEYGHHVIAELLLDYATQHYCHRVTESTEKIIRQD